jgi:hypothetical protein
MLCPTDYITDSKAVCGKVIDHKCHSREAIRHRQKRTVELWERNLGIPYDHAKFNPDRGELKGFQSRISYDLISASSRQKGFYYEVSLPHFTSEEFLELCLDRYKKFLYLKLKNRKEFIVPCYGIDIIWHTHQLLPKIYANETSGLLGYVFPHDDTTSDRSPGSKLTVSGDKTRQLWRDLYGEDFFFSGAMYRGDKPDWPYFSPNDKTDYSLWFTKKGSFGLVENKLICVKEAKKSEKTKYNMTITQNKRNVYEGTLKSGELLRFSQSYNYDESDEKTLDLRVYVKFKESFSDKFVHALKLQPAHNVRGDAYFDPKLIIPLKGSEYQSFAYKFKDPNDNEFTLDQKWKINADVDKSIIFGLLQQPFEPCHMNAILHEYGSFDLKNRDFSGNSGVGIRAKHVITGKVNNEKMSLYYAEVLHIVSMQWSSVKIFQGGNIFATSHLIGLTQLPSPSQIKNDSSAITFDTQNERAMLVRNLDGDYAIVKGKWAGMRQGIPPKKIGMRGKNYLNASK